MTEEDQPTALEQIEIDRRKHVRDAMIAAMGEAQSIEDVLAKIEDMAVAAIVAGDRYPTEGWPFDCNLRSVPAGLHPDDARAFENLDAALWNGDSFHSTDRHLYFAAHCQRWSKELRLRREDDWRNRPFEDDEDETDEPQAEKIKLTRRPL